MNILILVLFYYLSGMIRTCPNFIERHGIMDAKHVYSNYNKSTHALLKIVIMTPPPPFSPPCTCAHKVGMYHEEDQDGSYEHPGCTGLSIADLRVKTILRTLFLKTTYIQFSRSLTPPYCSVLATPYIFKVAAAEVKAVSKI